MSQFTLTYSDTGWNSWVTTVFHHNNKQRLMDSLSSTHTLKHNTRHHAHKQTQTNTEVILGDECFYHTAVASLSSLYSGWAHTSPRQSHQRPLTLTEEGKYMNVFLRCLQWVWLLITCRGNDAISWMWYKRSLNSGAGLQDHARIHLKNLFILILWFWKEQE